MGEKGILERCTLLDERGIGIEAGLLSLDDARSFVESGIAPRCVRVMVEPLDADPSVAVDHAVAHGHGIRTGLEDTPVLPDGRTAGGNGELVAAAASILEEGKT